MHSVFILNRGLGGWRRNPAAGAVGGSQVFPAVGPIRLALRIAAILAVAAATCRADLYVTTPGGMPTGKTVRAEALWEVFERVLPPDVWVAPLESNEYEVVSAKWMRRQFLPALKEQMKKLWADRIPEEDTAGTCSGFALVGRLMLSMSAMEAHARTPAAATVIVKQERAFGGLSATKEGHSVIFVLTDEGPWIIEAQSGAYTAIADYPNLKTIKLVSVH